MQVDIQLLSLTTLTYFFQRTSLMAINSILGQIKTDTAIITDINTRGVFLIADPSCEKKTACHGCTMCSEPPPSGPTLFCPNRESSDYKKNQIVTVRRFVPNEALAAVTVFGLPIVCALVTFFVLYMRNPAAADSLQTILLSIAAFVSGFVLLFLLDKIIQAIYPITIVDNNN